MAVAQVTGEVTTANLKGQQYFGVFVKQAWVDNWIYVPYLTPMFSSDNAAPVVGIGQFKYETGKILQNYDTLFRIYDPLFLQGWFIQVRGLTIFGMWTCWTGMVMAEALAEVGTNTRTAVTYSDQMLGAYDMKYPLRRDRVEGSYVGANADRIGRTLNFNERNAHGFGLMGNRSTNFSSAGVHTFSEDGKLWTNLDIAEYVLQFFQPDDVQYVFTGETSTLNQMVDAWKFYGLEPFEVLNKLINRRRGLGWKDYTTGSGSIEIYIFSISPETIGFSEFTIPENSWQDWINFDDLIDVHPNPQISRANTYDRIVVRGSPLKVCLSLALTNGTLEKGWTAAEETAYKAAADDRERGTDKHARVYQKFRVPKSWDWSYLSLKDNAPLIANPIVYADAVVDGTAPAPIWSEDHRFERNLPFEEDTAIADAEPTFRKAFVVVIDPENPGKYVYVDKLNTLSIPLGAMRVGVESREMALTVKGSINHQFALVDFSEATDADPQTDFNTMIATVMVQTDEVLRAEWLMPLDRASAGDGSVSIDVPDAEYWFAPGGTVKDVTDGNLIFWGDGGGEPAVIRDDGARLRAIAVAAAAWYGRTRNIVQYVHDEVAPFHPVGMMIIAATTTAFDATAIGTVVTRRRFDYTKRTMEVKTSYSELDNRVFTG